jgi:hypothetical protein
LHSDVEAAGEAAHGYSLSPTVARTAEGSEYVVAKE